MITADTTTLMRQVPMTIMDYYNDIMDKLDLIHGKGYAAKNPALVGQLVQAAASDFNTAILCQHLQYVGNCIGGVAETLEQRE